MGKTYRELVAQTDEQELCHWRALERIDGPLGPIRGDWQAASVCQAVLASQRVQTRIDEHLLRWRVASGGGEPMSEEEMRAVAEVAAADFNR